MSEVGRPRSGRFLCQKLQNRDMAVGVGCSPGKVCCLLISSMSLGLETAENNFKPLCQAPLPVSFLKMEPFTLDRLFFFPDVAILHTPSLRLAEETVDGVVTVLTFLGCGMFFPFFHFALLGVTLSFLPC